MRRRPHVLLLTLALAAAAVPAAAQEKAPPQTFDWYRGEIAASTPWGQAVDVESTRQILSWTTMAEYTNPLVDHLPADETVVSPTDHFGHPIGKPGVLHRAGEIHDYFRALAGSTPRVAFSELGPTEEGNRLALVQVGSARNLARLEEIRAAYARLADPRVADASEAERLVAELPVVYLLTAGLHSTETGPPEMVMELAYRLAVSDDPAIREIRENVVTLIVPVAEPDGRNRVVDWYRLHYPEPDTTRERVPGPPYWGKYIFHDNNRDGLQLTARLTQEIVGLIRDWSVPIAHDLHESVPYLYTSTGTGPYNPTVDPITVAEWTWFANYEVTALTALGMPGVWTHGFYDGWNPTYLIWAANTRNGMGRFYETFGNSLPWTVERTVGARTSVEWYRPNPPREKTLWSLRNNTNYMQSGVLTALSLAAQHRERLVRQYRTKAENALRKGRTSAPFAYVVPAAQERKADAAAMLDLLRRQGIEIHQATEPGTFAADPAVSPARRARAAAAAGDTAGAAAGQSAGPAAGGASAGDSVRVAPGDYVIRMDQPYRNLVLTLMQVQDFPAEAPRPYDDVAWTFPLMFGAEARAVTDSAVLAHPVQEAAGPIRPTGSVAGGGEWWLVPATGTAFSLPARLALGRTRVWALQRPVALGVDTVAAGAWLIRARDLPADRARRWADEHGLDLVGVADRAVAGTERHELDVPRIAILHTWRSTQPEGWARYTFDALGIPFTYIAETELRDLRPLRRRFDVIVFPDQSGDARAIFAGIDPKHGPLPYRATREHPSLGFPDETHDMTGGMRYEGLIALRDFVAAGGTLIALRAASTLPVAFGLVRDVDVLDTPQGLFIPGSIVRGKVERVAHPVAYGFGEDLALHHRFGPYLRVSGDQDSSVVVRYADRDLRLSGLVQNGERLARQPAVLSVPSGEGHYVLFGFNPLNRHQNFMNFGLVWNAILHWNDLDAGAAAGPGAAPVAAEGTDASEG